MCKFFSNITVMKKTVLLLDQDFNFLNIYNYILPKEQFYLIKCRDIANAMGFINSIQIRAIICDVDKPRGCGLELLRLLRDNGIKIPVIIVSGSFYPSDALITEAAFAFLPKVQINDLLPKLLAPDSEIWKLNTIEST